MKWRPSPLLCLLVFTGLGLVAFVFGWWWLSGLFAGWASLLTFALIGAMREGGAE